MKRRNITTALLAAMVAISMVSFAADKQEAPEKQQTHCPVMTKNPVNKNMYVDVKGYRIYVCCPGCIGKIKADPDKYIKQMEGQGIALEKAPMLQQKCPVTGETINKKLYVDANGKRIYVCCGGCIAKVKADPEKYIKQMEAKGITLENAPGPENPNQDK